VNSNIKKNYKNRFWIDFEFKKNHWGYDDKTWTMQDGFR